MPPIVHNRILDVVKDCDSFIHPDHNPPLYTSTLKTNYYAFCVSIHPGIILGYIPKRTVAQIAWSPANHWIINHTSQTVTLTAPSSEQYSAILAQTLANTSPSTLTILRGWRNEMFPVYGPLTPTNNDSNKNPTPLLEIERCASGLFGFVTYGVQLIAYVRDTTATTTSSSSTTPTNHQTREEENLKLWIARRSKHKQTYPGMLDCTAAGGLPTGKSPLEGVTAEAVEEASLAPELINERMVSTGCVSYFHVRGENAGGEGEMGLLQPEVEYTYEIDLSGSGQNDGEEGVMPVPADKEVEAFALMEVGEVLDALRRGEFKPNSAIVVVDFLIRHGVVTERTEGEEDFGEIGRRLRRELEREFPVRYYWGS